MTSFSALDASIQGSRPLEIYRFALGVDEYLYTNSEATVTVGTTEYQPIPIGRDSIGIGEEERRRSITITVPGNNSFATRYQQTPPGQKATISIMRLQWDEVPTFNTQQLIYRGNVKSVQFVDHGTVAKITAQTREAAIARTIPRYSFMGVCNHMLYGPGCDVDPTPHSFLGNVSAVNGNTITLDGAGASGIDFVGGFCRPTGAEDFRLILSQTGDNLLLLLPFETDVEGAIVQAFRGCNHIIDEDCALIFDNVEKNGSFSFVPNRNVFTDGLQ